MIQPRNTLLVLDIIEKTSQQVGKIVVPTNGDLYTEAEVVAVGPGINRHESEVFDLKVGQRVFVKYKEQRGNPMTTPPSLVGVKYIDDGKVFYIFEQVSILGILAEPTTAA